MGEAARKAQQQRTRAREEAARKAQQQRRAREEAARKAQQQRTRAREEVARKAKQERIAAEMKASEQKAVSAISPAPSSKLVPCPKCQPPADKGSFGTGVDPNAGKKCQICCGEGKVLPELVALTKCPDRFCTRRVEHPGDCYTSTDYDTAFEMVKRVPRETKHLKAKDKFAYTDDGEYWKFEEGYSYSKSIKHEILKPEQTRLVKAYLDAHLLSRGITPPAEVKQTSSKPVVSTGWDYQCDHLDSPGN